MFVKDPTKPVYFHPEPAQIPVNDYLGGMASIPPSKMFLIKRSLQEYMAVNGNEAFVYDASQGDGGASLPGVPVNLLNRANEIQIKQGTGYTMPHGPREYREAVIEQYWNLDPSLGYGPDNVAATVGGRDALSKAYQAMLNLGFGRVGDVVLVSRVPWISYNWGPYAAGANVMLAPGCPEDAWKFTPDSIRASVDFAKSSGRKISCLLITSPDNPTGRVLPESEQILIAKAALEAGIPYVFFDWIYRTVTDEKPVDINVVLRAFTPEERKQLIFLDGITKSLGGSNIRNGHLIASEEIIKFIVARASHTVIPSFYAMAVAMAAYEIGFAEASKTIIEPTNLSRKVLRRFLDENDYDYIIGQGYYAFINTHKWLQNTEWEDTIPLGEYAAKNFGVAVVPGAFNSPAGSEWVRFSYALPPEKTLRAINRFKSALDSLK